VRFDGRPHPLFRNRNVIAPGDQYKVRVAVGVGKDFVGFAVGHPVRDHYSVAGKGKPRTTIKLA
jgi:hypothetical protein